MKAVDFLTLYNSSFCEICRLEEMIQDSPQAMKGEYQKRIENLKEKCLNVLSAIEKIGDSKLQLVLKERYVKGSTFKEAAESLFLSERHFYRLHNRALKEIEKILEGD